jgi:histidinol-phosphate aminotransferase
MKPVDIESLIRENIRKLTPYSSARDDFQGNGSVFLDANENPFNPPFNRYPDPHQIALKKKIGSLKKVAPEQLFLGNGSDEAIDLLIRVFCQPGKDNVLIPQPTYGMYAVSAAIHDVEIRKVSLTRDFDLDTEKMESQWDSRTKLLFLCSPNNPSGNLLNPSKIEHLIKRFRGIVVLDEAYIDFIDGSGFVPRLGEFQNLVILQTLSKAWGLAGLRLGLCFAHTEIIKALGKIKPPYNINSLAQSTALEQLDHEKQKNAWVTEIKRQRSLLKQDLSTIPGVVKVYPSDTNFLLVKMKDARTVYDHLILKSIVVRDRSSVTLCENCLRITVGTANENKKLLEALSEL